MAMARSAGFVSVEYLDTEDQRAHFTARRQSSVETHPTSEFEIISFVNAMTHEAIFAARGDKILSSGFARLILLAHVANLSCIQVVLTLLLGRLRKVGCGLAG